MSSWPGPATEFKWWLPYMMNGPIHQPVWLSISRGAHQASWASCRSWTPPERWPRTTAFWFCAWEAVCREHTDTVYAMGIFLQLYVTWADASMQAMEKWSWASLHQIGFHWEWNYLPLGWIHYSCLNHIYLQKWHLWKRITMIHVPSSEIIAVPVCYWQWRPCSTKSSGLSHGLWWSQNLTFCVLIYFLASGLLSSNNHLPLTADYNTERKSRWFSHLFWIPVAFSEAWVSVQSHPKGGRAECSDWSKWQQEDWAEGQLQIETPDVSDNTGTRRGSRAACGTAPEQPLFTAGILSKPETVSFEKW